MFRRIYGLTEENIFGKPATVISGLGSYSLADTMECGQCFRHVRLVGGGGYTDSAKECLEVKARERARAEDITEYPEGYTEYLTVACGRVLRIGQREAGELILFGIKPDDVDESLVSFLSLEKDFDRVREEIKLRTDSALLRELADASSGIALLTQDPWECVFSFIISQNNNIPRIRKIIRALSAHYGQNLSLSSGVCPITGTAICEGKCKECGICYTFPKRDAVLADGGAGLASAKVGFRYRYLMSLCELTADGTVDLEKIKKAHSLDYTLTTLKQIVGIGDKVASCCALFAFENYDAFPVDVWIKRAIDTYFDGSLNISALGDLAGVAQQYIFHGIRNLNED